LYKGILIEGYNYVVIIREIRQRTFLLQIFFERRSGKDIERFCLKGVGKEKVFVMLGQVRLWF
jgi:hypothetical protein